MSIVTDWIQASTGVCAFVGLVVYAYDTRKMRRATLAQATASQRPLFRLQIPPAYKVGSSDEEYEKRNTRSQRWRLKNVGAGIALHVNWRFVNDKDGIVRGAESDVAVGKSKTLDSEGKMVGLQEIVDKGGLYITYSDLAGVRYWNQITVRMLDGYCPISCTMGEFKGPGLLDRIEAWNRSFEG